VKDSLLPPFCERLLFSVHLLATRRVKAIRPDSLLRQPQLFCDRLWLSAKKQGTRQAKTMQRPLLVSRGFGLFCARDVLPAKALLQATRPDWATELAQHKRRQVRLQRRE
jgi:hypothetical protein